MGHRPALEDTLDKDPPTGRSQTGITVDHEDLLVVGVCGNHQPKRSSPFHRVTNVVAKYT
jgi:hypothetical protein